MKSTIAYCGLNCEECNAYIATINNDQELLEKTAKLWSKLNNTTILPNDLKCQGCRTNGIKNRYCKDICKIRKCALTKDVETCGKCLELEKCETIKIITSNKPEALKNLKDSK